MRVRLVRSAAQYSSISTPRQPEKHQPYLSQSSDHAPCHPTFDAAFLVLLAILLAILLDQEDMYCAELSVGYLPNSERISFVQLEAKVPISANARSSACQCTQQATVILFAARCPSRALLPGLVVLSDATYTFVSAVGAVGAR